MHGWKAMDLTVNLAPSYRDLKDPTTRQNFDDTLEQKRVIDLRPCHNLFHPGIPIVTIRGLIPRAQPSLIVSAFIIINSINSICVIITNVTITVIIFTMLFFVSIFT